MSDAHFRHGAAHPTQTREHISHTAARSKRSEPTACPIPPVRTLGLSYPAGSCCRALPSIPFLSSAFLSSPAPSTTLLSRSQRIPPFSPLTTPTPVEPTSVAMGLRLAPASLPSHSTMLLHSLHKNICGFRHGRAAHRAPLSLLPADGWETLHPALAAGQAHCSSELRSFGAASTPARRGRPGEGDRRQHLLRLGYSRCPWPCRAAARAARAAPGKLRLCQER